MANEVKLNNNNAAVSPGYVPKLLGLHSSGPEVKALQEDLNKLGFDCGTADGDFGKKTLKALKEFQKSVGIKDDGIVGPDTRIALAAAKAKLKTDKDSVSISNDGIRDQKNRDADILNYPIIKDKGRSRLEDQQQAAQDFLNGLAQDARYASIVLNPIFTGPALAISLAAQARAIHRYETEVPQKDYSVILREEQSKARQQILSLPQVYLDGGKAALEAIETAGAAIAGGAVAAAYAIMDYGSQALTYAQDVATSAWDDFTSAMGKAWHWTTTPVRWVGSVYSGIGNWLQGVGGRDK